MPRIDIIGLHYVTFNFTSFFKKNFSKELSLQTNAQVVYFEAGKDMKVSYNRRLVGLHTEVRILGGQGYNIPQKIMATSEQARKFAKLAR